MSTNYYVAGFCECIKCQMKHMCDYSIFIGVSSDSRFLFAYNGGKYYKNISGLKEWLKDKQIINEHGERIDYDEFWKMVENAQRFPLNPYSRGDWVVDGYRFKEWVY